MMRSRKRRLQLSLEILIAALLLFIVTGFFETRFYPGTKINGVNFSLKTPDTADAVLNELASSYVLILKERGGMAERITGTEIGVRLNAGSASIKKAQNKTVWVLSFFGHNAIRYGNAFTFDENLLRERMKRLDCLDESGIIKPKNASLVYSNGVYTIVREVYGNQVDVSGLYSGIIDAVINGRAELDLEKLECYVSPGIRSDSQKIKNTKAAAEGYLASRILYTLPGGNEVVDERDISKWIEFDSDLTIVFNKQKIKEYLYDLSDRYDTCGKTRDFVTSSGKRIEVVGGDYGWKIDIKGETADLIEAVMSGKTIGKEPDYIQRGAVHAPNDIGSTYVEIDLSKQHLWYYKDGMLIAHGNVVTGNIKKDYGTPEGVFSLKYRIRNAVLKGEGYEAKVTYWMPFNNDIGIHDASWRTAFGGNIYLSRGSHGCVNAPYQLAEKIFNSITVGTPIVCYNSRN